MGSTSLSGPKWFDDVQLCRMKTAEQVMILNLPRGPRWTKMGYRMLVLLLLSYTELLSATSILEVSFSELCRDSQVIVEGRVSRVTTKRDENSGLIWTVVTIDTSDLISGNLSKPVLQLEFLGGTHNGVTLNVGEMQVPEAGETGIYFINKPGAKQVHPLTGWGQGHFILQTDAKGIQRIATARKRPVAQVEPSDASEHSVLSKGTAKGVKVVAGAKPPLSQAMNADDFKALIRTTSSEFR
ncbi:MAG: hypothetical protein DRQ98_12130 [Gammaproteobacteria bacterium]|nr:MAG: hypothetical protein DRQ98_12130 [Gammaproteobacteria bacterium]